MKNIYLLTFLLVTSPIKAQDHYQQKFGDHFNLKGIKSNFLFHNYRYFFVENHLENTSISNNVATISITELNMDGDLVNFQKHNFDTLSSPSFFMFNRFSNAVLQDEKIYVARSSITATNECHVSLYIFDLNGNFIQSKLISTDADLPRKELMLSKYGSNIITIGYYGEHSNYIKRHFIDISNQHQNYYTHNIVVQDSLIEQSPNNYFKYQQNSLSNQKLSMSVVDKDIFKTVYLLNGKNGAILIRCDQLYSHDDTFYFQGYSPGGLKIKDDHIYFTLNGDQDIRFIKMDFNGNTLWDKSIPHIKNRHISHLVAPYPPNKWVVNRSYYDFYNNIESEWLVFDQQGDLVSQHYDDVIQLECQYYDTYMYTTGHSTLNESSICSSGNSNSYPVGSYVIKREKNLNMIKDLTKSNVLNHHYNFYYYHGRGTSEQSFTTGVLIDSTLHNPLNFISGFIFSGKETTTGEYYGHMSGYESRINMGPYGAQNRTEYDKNFKWNNVWLVTKEQVDAHILAYQQGDFSYRMPMSIKYWPGNGNSNYNEPDQVLPYKDLNNDGIYQPDQGEYPIIKGDWTSARVYNISKDWDYCFLENDLKVDVYEINYGFICDQDSSLKHSYFKEYTMINRSNITLDSLYIGEYNDGEIGCSVNDYMGTDVSRGMTYIYNAELVDFSCLGAYGFGENIPAIGFGILKGPKKESNGIDDPISFNSYGSASGFGFNDGIIDNEYLGLETSFYPMNPSSGAIPPITSDPDSPTKLFKQMSVSHEIAQYVTANGENAKHIFFNDSDPMHYSTGGIDPGQPNWNEVTANNQSGDRRVMGCSGPVVFHPGDTIHFVTHETSAIPYANDSLFIGVRLLENYVDDIRLYYENNQTPCGQNFYGYEPFDGVYEYLSIEDESLNIKVYPNPFNEKLVIESDYPIEQIVLYDMSGRILKQIPGEHLKYNQVQWGNLMKGNYILQLKGTEHSNFHKIVKL